MPHTIPVCCLAADLTRLPRLPIREPTFRVHTTHDTSTPHHLIPAAARTLLPPYAVVAQRVSRTSSIHIHVHVPFPATSTIHNLPSTIPHSHARPALAGTTPTLRWIFIHYT
ncbi:hypothetical protein JB92DRAFT_2988469 [Gautieria morchelliformis]|nr:hypothetical protein JB92DRAFT_2988469 [Gautieria morchelliformis]